MTYCNSMRLLLVLSASPIWLTSVIWLSESLFNSFIYSFKNTHTSNRRRNKKTKNKTKTKPKTKQPSQNHCCDEEKKNNAKNAKEGNKERKKDWLFVWMTSSNIVRVTTEKKGMGKLTSIPHSIHRFSHLRREVEQSHFVLQQCHISFDRGTIHHRAQHFLGVAEKHVQRFLLPRFSTKHISN